MLSSLDGQPVARVVMDHLWDGQEGSPEVTEHEHTRGCVSFDLHVHNTFGTPARQFFLINAYLESSHFVRPLLKEKLKLTSN